MKKPPPILTPRIIADMRAGEERADPDHAGLRVRRTNAARVFFYRYRTRGGALREIKLEEFGPMTLAEARKALGRMKLERERSIDPQLEKQHARTEARRQRDAEKLARYTENLVEHYIEERLTSRKRGNEGARLLRRELTAKLGTSAGAYAHRIRPSKYVPHRVAQIDLGRTTWSSSSRRVSEAAG